MRYCNHSHWLSLSVRGNDTILLETDRLQALTNEMPNPDKQYPSLFVFVGNSAKPRALQALGAVKQVRTFNGRRSHGEINLQLDPSSVFQNRTTLLADGDLAERSLRGKIFPVENCHETVKRALPRIREGVPGLPLDSVADKLYSRLLYHFADVFCFFSTDLGGFRPITRHLAAWLENGEASTLPKSTHLRVIIVSDSISPEAGKEKQAREVFLSMLREETTKDLFEYFSAVDVVALLPEDQMSTQARHRRLKEHLMSVSD